MIETDGTRSEWYYWWVAASGFIVLLVEGGVRAMLIIYFSAFQEDLNWSKSTFSTIIAVINAASLLSGPLAAIIYQVFSARLSVSAAALITALGFVLASLSSSVIVIIVVAFAIGIGCGVMRTAIVSVQCEYFIRNRDFVMALIFIGPGVGQFLFALILSHLNNLLSWRTSWRIIAAIFLSCVLLAFPIKRKMKKGQHNQLAQFLGIKVLKVPEFLVQLIAVFFASSLCISYYIFEVPLMVERGIDRDTAASVFGSHGIASIAGRILTTLLIRSGKMHIAVVMLLCYVVAQSSMLAAVFCATLSQFLVHNILSGFGVGMYSVSLAPFLLHISGPKQLPTAFGYTNLINGLAAFVAMFIGNVADWYGVMVAFGVVGKMGALSIVACIAAVAIILYKERKQRKHEPIPTEDSLPQKDASESV